MDESVAASSYSTIWIRR